MLNKKNTFKDYISCAEHLIKKKYTYTRSGIAFYGGSAGGTTGGCCN